MSLVGVSDPQDLERLLVSRQRAGDVDGMDLGLGDIFNCRVAGNIENEDILGSMSCGSATSRSRRDVRV